MDKMQHTLEDRQMARSEVPTDVGGVQAPTDEWTLAALAHASVLLTLVLGMAGGIGALVGPIIPLMMVLGYRGKSRFVAQHALQSLVYQAVGLVVYVVLVAVMAGWVTIAWTVSGILSAVLVGLLFIPFALLFTVLTVFLLVCTPIVWLGYGLYAAYQVYQGRDFRYWMIGEWLEREARF